MSFNFGMPIYVNSESRNEVILVKFQGCIKNVGEMMFKSAQQFSNYESYWRHKYPVFAMIEDYDDERAFEALSAFTALDALKYLMGKTAFPKLDEIMTDYAKLMAAANPYHVSVTNIELIIKRFLRESICKKVIIYDAGFSEITKSYIREVFDSSKEKISVVEGKLSDIITEYPEITTIFSDDLQEVCDIIQSEKEGTDKFKGKMFMVSSTPNIEFDKDMKPFLPNEKFLSEMPERFKCLVKWFQLKFVTRFDNTNKPSVNIKEELL